MQKKDNRSTETNTLSCETPDLLETDWVVSSGITSSIRMLLTKNILLTVFVMTSPFAACTAQTIDLQRFTRDASEHYAEVLKDPIVVKRVQGQVVVPTTPPDPLKGVLVELRRDEAGSKIRRTHTDSRGNFKFSHVPVGTYIFKLTYRNMLGLAGQVRVTKDADDDRKMVLEMKPGT